MHAPLRRHMLEIAGNSVRNENSSIFNSNRRKFELRHTRQQGSKVSTEIPSAASCPRRFQPRALHEQLSFLSLTRVNNIATCYFASHACRMSLNFASRETFPVHGSSVKPENLNRDILPNVCHNVLIDKNKRLLMYYGWYLLYSRSMAAQRISLKQ